MNTAISTHRSLDRRGKTITTFVLYDASEALESMAEADTLELLTDDFEPFYADVAAWSQATGQRLVQVEATAEGIRFLIEKRPRPPKDSSLAMVISTDGLGELLAPLGFALAAALEGIEVHLYFLGPAVKVLSRRYRPKLSGWARPFSRFAAAGMTKTGHIPAQAKLEQLQTLGAHLYVCGPSMQHFKVGKEDLIFSDLPLIEYFTFMTIMEQSDINLYL